MRRRGEEMINLEAEGLEARRRMAAVVVSWT